MNVENLCSCALDSYICGVRFFLLCALAVRELFPAEWSQFVFRCGCWGCVFSGLGLNTRQTQSSGLMVAIRGPWAWLGFLGASGMFALLVFCNLCKCCRVILYSAYIEDQNQVLNDHECVTVVVDIFADYVVGQKFIRLLLVRLEKSVWQWGHQRGRCGRC